MTAPHARPEWVKPIALAVLAAGGLGGGLYLANLSPTPVGPADVPVHRFPLTAADAKDTQEAPVLTADPGGRLYLAWASRTGDDERTLFLARSDDAGGRFDGPKAVTTSGVSKSVSQMKGKTVTREVRMAPHLVTAGPAVALAWTEALADRSGVRMVVAASADRGDTFSPPRQLHRGAGARPTFTALAAGPDGTFLASWLDNRNRAQQCYAAVRPAGAPAFDPEGVVHAGDGDKGVCPCCPTAALVGPDGTAFVAFRNVANGYRDIAIGVKKPGESAFTLHPVVPPAWVFSGCPHDGPSLARVGDTLHVTWMDARSGPQRCYHASARLSEMAFTARELNPIAAGTQGNAKLFADAAGTLHAVWEESAGAEPPADAGHRHEPATPTPGVGGRAVMVRSWPAGAAGFGEARAVHARPGAFQTRPAVIGTPAGELVVAWNELDETGKAVVVTRLGEPGAK